MNICISYTWAAPEKEKILNGKPKEKIAFGGERSKEDGHFGDSYLKFKFRRCYLATQSVHKVKKISLGVE